MEPIILLDQLQQQPQPVTQLYELCQKHGKQVDFRHCRSRDRNVASVFVDGKFVVSATSEQKENAKFQAAIAALDKLRNLSTSLKMDISDGVSEIEGAKQKLHEVCGKRKWPKPCYRYAFLLLITSFSFYLKRPCSDAYDFLIIIKVPLLPHLCCYVLNKCPI